jgi:hypothetical protein
VVASFDWRVSKVKKVVAWRARAEATWRTSRVRVPRRGVAASDLIGALQPAERMAT